jgi:DNA polymerase
MPIIHRDIETFSTLNLAKTGPWKYAGDPSTGVWCVAYAVDDGPVQIWAPGQPIPEEFQIAARDLAWTVTAHNDSFEASIEERILAPRCGWPLVPIERHRCTMAAALAGALPGGLDKVAAALRLDLRKDDAGRRLMLTMAKPRKPRAGEDPGGVYFHDDPERIHRLQFYCIRDVELERALHHRLPPLSDSEQALWVLDQQINRRGFPVDIALAKAASKIARERRTAIDAEIAELTGGRITSANQVAKIEAFLKERGHNVQSVGKRSVAAVLAHKPDADVAQLLRLRQEAAKASASKLATLLAAANDGRLHNTLKFHGAATGRWSGSKFQPQNLSRSTPADLDVAIAAVNSGELARVSEIDEPLAVIGSLSRAMICAEPAKILISADYSAIESRVLAWLAGEKWKLQNYRDFDRTGDPRLEPYCATATKMLHREVTPADEAGRQHGKTADLALGYGGSVGAWRKFMLDDPRSDEQIKRETVEPWRTAHPVIVHYWGALHRTLLRGVRTGKPVMFKNLSAQMRNGNFYLRLPSGREIVYPEARIQPGQFGSDEIVFKDSALGKWQDERAWHGTFAENVVSGISRDLLAGAMLRLEAAGYSVVLHVHDEIVSEVPEDFGSPEEFAALMAELPAWAEGLPLVAKASRRRRYAKEGKASTEPTGEIEEEIEEDEADEQSADSAASITPEDVEEINEGPAREGIEPIEMASPTMAAAIADMVASIPREQSTTSESVGAQPDSGGDPQGNDGDYARNDDERQRIGRVVATYLYRDHLGRNHTRIEKRISAKAKRAQYPQAFWVGHWVHKKPDGWRAVPYNLPELLAALASQPVPDVFLPEGERDCDSLTALGLVASTNPEGATPLNAKTGKWTPELNKWFAGVQRLFILAENDEVGRLFALEKTRALRSIVPDIRIVYFPDVPEHEDVTYWLEHGHDKDELLARCAIAPPWQGDELESLRADQVTMRAVDWLWPNRFALGKLGLIVGLPDEGKGLLISFIAAQVTTGGPWPLNEGVAVSGNVLLLSAEDDPNDTVVPRLVAAGADLARIEIVKMVRAAGGDRMFSLQTDLDMLRRKITAIGNVVLILIDPISAYLGVGKMDSYRTTDVRAVLGPVVNLAAELALAIIGIMHFNKKLDVTNALLRISDSLAYGATARHVYGVIDDAENHRKLLVRAKNNLALNAGGLTTLAFSFGVNEVGVDPNTGKIIAAPYVIWQSQYVDVTATEAMRAANESKSPSALDDAKQFLRDILIAGGGRALQTEIEEAAKAEKISDATLKRAKKALKVRAEKERTKEGRWFWVLPEDTDT